jgi:hypothetical protein
MRWLWVSLPYATFGVGFQGGRAVEAAPIAAWTLGKSERHVVSYYERKGATLKLLP